MGKVMAQLAMSIDGFIADQDDGCDDLFGFYDNGDVAVNLSGGLAGAPRVETTARPAARGGRAAPARRSWAGGSTTSPTGGTATPAARCRWSC